MKHNAETAKTQPAIPGAYLSRVFTWILTTFLLVSLAGLLSVIDAHGTAKTNTDRTESRGSGTVWPHDDSDLAPSPGIVFGRLDNGIRYVLKENEKPEERASMHLNVQIGSYHEAEDERGIAHFLEHMLFQGTEHFEPGELVKYFQRIGMKFGPDVNASTGFYRTIYDIDLPEANPDSISEALLVLRDYAAGGRIPENEVEKEKSVILSEKRTRDSPSYRTFKETLAFELPGVRVTRRLPIGTRDVIKNADRDLIKTFYDTWYRPGNIIIVMVGDFDVRKAEDLIEKRFSDLSPRAPEKQRPDFGTFKHNGVKPFYHYEPESGSTRVTIEVIQREDQPDDSTEYRENRLLEQMANRIVKHRLESILNTSEAPFIRASTSSGYYFNHVRAAEIEAQCEPEKWDETLGVLEKNLRKTFAHGFTEAETTRVKREFTAKLERDEKAAPTRKSKSIARQLLNELNQDRVTLLAGEKLALLRPVIEGVTAEKLEKAFRNAWRRDHRLVMVTGNADLSEDKKSPEQTIRAVYNESRKQTVEKPAESEGLVFPYLDRPETPGDIKNREHIEDLGITRVLFENGMTLFVKKTDFKANEVLASLRFGEGRRSEPKDKDGLSQLSQKVVNLGGLGAMNRDQLRRAMAGTSTSVSFSVEEDAFSFSGRSVANETDLLFERLYAHVKDPGYRKSAYTRAIRQFEREYESLAHSIEGALPLKGQRFLAGGDTRFGLPPFKAITENNLDDIENWIEAGKNAGTMELSVVGDIDPDVVIDLTARFFGTLPTTPPDAETDNERQPVFPQKQRLEHEVPTRMNKALLMVSYPSTDIYNIKQSRRLSILSAIVSDRMRIRIRDELGAAYSQGAYNRPSRAYEGYGVFSAYAIVDPAMANKIENEIKDISADIKDTGATEDELQRAVRPMLAGITDQLKTNTYWLNTVLKGAARHPAQIDWSRTIFMDYATMDVEAINKTAAKFLENDTAATLLFLPAETSENGNSGNTEKKEAQ